VLLVAHSLGHELRQQPELVQRPAAGHAHRQQAGEEGDGIDRLASLGIPVVIVQIEPQGELVQGQRRGDPVRRRGQPRGPFRGRVADPEPVGPQVADPEQAEDPERAVVDVLAAGADVPERAALSTNGGG
jgi:hypothetical protein